MSITSRLLAAKTVLPLALPAAAQDMAVYHIDNSEAQATKSVRSIRNHLDVAPQKP